MERKRGERREGKVGNKIKARRESGREGQGRRSNRRIGRVRERTGREYRGAGRKGEKGRVKKRNRRKGREGVGKGE